VSGPATGWLNTALARQDLACAAHCDHLTQLITLNGESSTTKPDRRFTASISDESTREFRRGRVGT
jgi:hypothetical protein